MIPFCIKQRYLSFLSQKQLDLAILANAKGRGLSAQEAVESRGT